MLVVIAGSVFGILAQMIIGCFIGLTQIFISSALKEMEKKTVKTVELVPDETWSTASWEFNFKSHSSPFIVHLLQ